MPINSVVKTNKQNEQHPVILHDIMLKCFSFRLLNFKYLHWFKLASQI